MHSYRLDNFISQLTLRAAKMMNSGYQFPLFGYSGNVITSRKGDKSYCYQLIPQDLEQVEPQRYDDTYQKIIASLNALSSSSFCKIFLKDGNVFLNTDDDDFRFNYYHIDSLERPLSIFFDESKIYSDIFFGSDYMKVNGRYLRIISFKDLNFENLRVEEFEEYGSYAIIFKKKNPFILKQSLDLRRNLHLHQFTGHKRDINSEKAYDAIEETMEEIIDGREAVFKVLPLVYIMEKDFSSLNYSTEWVLDNLTQQGHSPFIESSGLRYFYNQILFGVKPSLNIRGHDLKTSDLVKLLPTSRDYLCEEGIEFESLSGNKIHYCVEKTGNNSNAFFAGPTGRGKSYLALTMLNHYVEQGQKGFVLEFGESARKFTMWHKGKSFGGKINITQFKDVNYLRDCVLFLIGEEDKFSANDRGRLVEVIEDGVKENKFSTNKEFINYLEGHFKGIRYYFAPVKQFLTDELVSEDAQVIHCNLKQYDEQMKGLILLNLFQMFKQFKGKKKFLVDEIYKILRKEYATSISEYARNVRKDGQSIWCSVQNLNDINDKRYELLGVIFEACEHKFIFEHDSPIIVELETFKKEVLSRLRGRGVDDNAYTRTERKASLFMISNSIHTKIARLIKENLMYEVLTSEDDDKELFREFEQERGRFFKNFRERMFRFVELKYGI